MNDTLNTNLNLFAKFIQEKLPPSLTERLSKESFTKEDFFTHVLLRCSICSSTNIFTLEDAIEASENSSDIQENYHDKNSSTINSSDENKSSLGFYNTTRRPFVE